MLRRTVLVLVFLFLVANMSACGIDSPEKFDAEHQHLVEEGWPQPKLPNFIKIAIVVVIGFVSLMGIFIYVDHTFISPRKKNLQSGEERRNGRP